MKRFYLCTVFFVVFCLVGCKSTSNEPESTSSTSAATDTTLNTGDLTSDYVENQTFNTTIFIVWSGSSAMVSGSADGVTITNESGYVTITSTVKNIAYSVSGSGNGQLSIYSTYKFKLVLDGLSLTCPDGPAINNQCKKSCYAVVSGTNTLVDGSSYRTTDEDRKAAFFSEGQVIFSGTGTLNITGNYKHALASDDYIRFREGTLVLTSNVSDGMHTNDGIIVDGGSITVNAVGEGLQADTSSVLIQGGTVTVTTQDKGIWAYSCLYITDGIVTVNAKDKGIKCMGPIYISGGSTTVTSSSDEGIESKSTLTVTGGYVYAKAYDDAINSASHMTISGGYVMAYATNNDGIDANGNFYLKGGTVYAVGSKSPEVGIDANSEAGYKVYIESGNLIAVNGIENGASMSQTCYSASVSTNSWYGLYDGSDLAVAFKSLGSSIVLSSGSCSLYSGVTTSGSTIWSGYGNTAASGGSSVSLSTYSGGAGMGGGGTPGGGPGGGGFGW